MSERVSDERLANVLSYCDSPERQGYPVPLSEFKAIVSALIDSRTENATLRARCEQAEDAAARRQATNLQLVELSKGLENERDTLEASCGAIKLKATLAHDILQVSYSTGNDLPHEKIYDALSVLREAIK